MTTTSARQATDEGQQEIHLRNELHPSGTMSRPSTSLPLQDLATHINGLQPENPESSASLPPRQSQTQMASSQAVTYEFIHDLYYPSPPPVRLPANSEWTTVCGVYSPEKCPPMARRNSNDPAHKFQCPRCDKTFTRSYTVKSHFTGCIAKHGNPEALRWLDHSSLGLNLGVHLDRARRYQPRARNWYNVRRSQCFSGRFPANPGLQGHQIEKEPVLGAPGTATQVAPEFSRQADPGVNATWQVESRPTQQPHGGSYGPPTPQLGTGHTRHVFNEALDQNLPIEAARTPPAYVGPIAPHLQAATGFTQEDYSEFYVPPLQLETPPMQEAYTYPDGTIHSYVTVELTGQPYVTPYMPLAPELGRAHNRQGYNEGYGNSPQIEAELNQQASSNLHGDYNRVDAPT